MLFCVRKISLLQNRMLLSLDRKGFKATFNVFIEEYSQVV